MATGKLNLTVMSAAFLIFGLSLTFQAHRWASTPAYHILLQIFAAQVWGVLFLVSGVAMAAAVWQFPRRWVVIAALILAFTLTTGWMLGFVVRYLSSSSTTPETWVSWAIFDFLLVKVAMALDHPGDHPTAAETGDLARLALDEARNAILLAEEAYARATGQAAHTRDTPDAP
jgi:small-conductance mechanosensitive channel